MDTSWIELPNNHIDYINGVIEFINLAKETLIEGRTRCPCKRCKVDKWLMIDEVERHILFKGFYKPYKNWIHHRKADVVLRDRSESSSQVNNSNESSVVGHDDMRGLLDATFDNSAEMEIMRAKMLKMEKENQELRSRIDQSNQILLQALNAIRTGKVTDEFFESAQLALRVPNSQVGSDASGNSNGNGSADQTNGNGSVD